jgi:hypothetical protein
MVESICGQDFAYARKVEEERAKDLVKLEQKTTKDTEPTADQNLGQKVTYAPALSLLL